jgi:hypothetical protein
MHDINVRMEVKASIRIMMRDNGMCQASEKRKKEGKRTTTTVIHAHSICFFLLTERVVKAEYRSRTSSVIL